MAPEYVTSDGQIAQLRGHWAVLDVRLGAALGYERPRDIRKLIERLKPGLERLALARHRVAPIASGKGRLMETTEYLLTQSQVNYLITLDFAHSWGNRPELTRVIARGRPPQ